MSMPRYGEYKDSGVEWLGSVPSHWTIGPLKRRYEVCLGKMLQTDSSAATDSLKPYLRAANIQWSGVDAADVKSMWFSPRDLEQLRLQAGDLLVSEGGDVGRAAVWGNELSECYIQNSVNRVRAKAHDSTRFLYYWMAALKAKGYIDVLCNKSTIAHFTAEKVAEVATPFPPEIEQAAIASFLDHETDKIDALIAEQEKLVALLAEKRQAAISRAVTRGLNPYARMVDSGVAWLGEVPAHWQPVRLKALFRQTKRQGFATKQVLSVYRDYGVISKESRSDNFNKTPVDLSSYQLVMPNDLVVNKMKGWQGSLGVSALEGITSPDYIVFSPLHSHVPEFLHLLLRSAPMVGVYRSISNGIRPAQWRLEPEAFLALNVLLPPVVEQQSIVAACSKETAKLYSLTEQTMTALDLLRERRSALIAAAVTGRIDVRGAHKNMQMKLLQHE